MAREEISSMTKDEIRRDFAKQGWPAFRVRQVCRWLHRGVEDFEQMTDQSKVARQFLAQEYYISVVSIEKKLISQYDNIVRYLFRFADGGMVESVLMQYHHGYTICISTQVSCEMGCTSCVTGQSGFSRNLTPTEILAQIQAAQKDTGQRISNIVLMGMGKPLDNYKNMSRFLGLVSSEHSLSVGMRHTFLSTRGVVDKIYDLADRRLQLTLSVSLHTPNNNIRPQTMSVDRKWSVDELLKACRYYSEQTHRRISFEYAMISGVNDSDACAKELARELRGMLSHINLIPVNQVTGTGYHSTPVERQRAFIHILEKSGLTATVRRTLGSGINASYGQLRRGQQEEVTDL